MGQLTKAFANEWASKGVNVNAIAPGYFATDNTEALQEEPRAGAARSLSGFRPVVGETLKTLPAQPFFSPPPPATTSTATSSSSMVAGSTVNRPRKANAMKKRHLAILALAATCAPGFRSNAQTTQITGIAHIAYRSGDLDKEVAFLKKLGFEEAFSSTNAAGKTTQAFLKVNDQQFIEVYPQSDPAQPLGWMHVCYESGDLNALYATLTANGLKPSEVRKAGAGNLISSLDDPEGRVTEFTQYMPGSRHTLDKGQHLGEHRISDEMLGFSCRFPTLKQRAKFYVAGMGFEARDARSGLRMSLARRTGAAHSDPHRSCRRSLLKLFSA